MALEEANNSLFDIQAKNTAMCRQYAVPVHLHRHATWQNELHISQGLPESQQTLASSWECEYPLEHTRVSMGPSTDTRLPIPGWLGRKRQNSLTAQRACAPKQTLVPLHTQANPDKLAVLASRRLLRDCFQRAVGHSNSGGIPSALFVNNSKGFKCNSDSDSLDDTVSSEVAKRLSTTLRSTDTAVKFWEDEFAVIIEGIVTLSAARSVCVALWVAIEERIELICSRYVLIGSSRLLSMYPSDRNELKHVLTIADQVIYAVNGVAQALTVKNMDPLHEVLKLCDTGTTCPDVVHQAASSCSICSPLHVLCNSLLYSASLALASQALFYLEFQMVDAPYRSWNVVVPLA